MDHPPLVRKSPVRTARTVDSAPCERRVHFDVVRAYRGVSRPRHRDLSGVRAGGTLPYSRRFTDMARTGLRPASSLALIRDVASSCDALFDGDGLETGRSGESCCGSCNSILHTSRNMGRDLRRILRRIFRDLRRAVLERNECGDRSGHVCQRARAVFPSACAQCRTGIPLLVRSRSFGARNTRASSTEESLVTPGNLPWIGNLGVFTLCGHLAGGSRLS